MTIKKIARTLFLAAALALALPAPASAQPVYVPPLAKVRPNPTSAGYVAMLYTKMTRQAPDFEKWAMASKDYANAAQFDKMVAAKEKIAELKGVYELLTPNEPLIIELPAKLSEYSQLNGGFFLDNLREDQLFSYNFFSRFYGVAPMNIMDFQWLKVTPAQARAIAAAKADPANKITAVFYVEPKYADKSAPFDYEGQAHWLISGEVRKMSLFDENGLLWASPDKEAEEAASQELLNLKQ